MNVIFVALKGRYWAISFVIPAASLFVITTIIILMVNKKIIRKKWILQNSSKLNCSNSSFAYKKTNKFVNFTIFIQKKFFFSDSFQQVSNPSNFSRVCNPLTYFNFHNTSNFKQRSSLWMTITFYFDSFFFKIRFHYNINFWR